MRPELARVFEDIRAAPSSEARTELLAQIGLVLERSTWNKFEKANAAEVRLYKDILPPELFLVRLRLDEHQEIVDFLLTFGTGPEADATAWFAIIGAASQPRRHAALSVLIREGYSWQGALAHQLLVAFRDWSLVSDPDELRILHEAHAEEALRQLAESNDWQVAELAQEILAKLRQRAEG